MAQFVAQGRLKLLFNGENVSPFLENKDPFLFKCRSVQTHKRRSSFKGSSARFHHASSSYLRSKLKCYNAEARPSEGVHDEYEYVFHYDDSDSDSDDDGDVFEGDGLACFRGLVLDISYRPVNVVCWKRAICLEFMEKADVLEYYDKTVNSPSGSFYIPAVLRVRHLLQVIKRRRVGTNNLSRKNILFRDNYTCQYCSSHENLTHYITMKNSQYPCTFFLNNFNFNARSLSFQFNNFFIQLCYFIILSLFGYLGLKLSKPRSSIRPNDFDLFYTSVSASTVSSMTSIEMEVFSNFQLILLTLLMLVGGEVFTSMLQLFFDRFNFTQKNHCVKNECNSNINQIELGLVSMPHSENQTQSDDKINNKDKIKYNSLRYLSYVVFGYLMLVHFFGFSLVTLYIAYIPSAKNVLKNKGIKIETFSLFTIVSTFASCGYVPTNENMIVFKKNSGLLLLILPHILLGNTLYPPCLRLFIKVLKSVTKREDFSYLLKNSKEMGYDPLLSSIHCWLLVVTVFGFNVIQFILFCSMEWSSKIMEGLNLYQKVVASLFQVTNARHTGESVFDLSTISSAMLVIFVFMMYLPPYTTFLPARDHKNIDVKRSDQKSVVEYLVFSQLSYLVIFIILICITERQSLKDDPLNFNVFNITLEVISAYGNVGFSTGYSCSRQLKPDSMCKDLWIGFSGRWSTKGKFILILVMFFGRLKKFNMNGGKSWHLS